MKIVVLDGYGLNPGDLSWEWLEKYGEPTVYDRTFPGEILSRASDADILFTNKVALDRETLAALPSLKYVGVLATGYNIVDIEAAAQYGITVTNIPSYSTMSVAQMVFALLFAVTNRVEHYAVENRGGRWSGNPDFCYWDYPLTELAGKKFGIVGLGHIGKAVAGIASAFGMEVIAYTSKSQDELPKGVRKVSLDELFCKSDVLSLHCPLTPETNHLVNVDRLKCMKSTAILINTGRGPLIEESAVADALRNGRIAGFGADVLSVEPPAADNPLLSAPNAFVTPHIAWATVEARKRLMDICEKNLAAYLSGAPVNVVS